MYLVFHCNCGRWYVNMRITCNIINNTLAKLKLIKGYLTSTTELCHLSDLPNCQFRMPVRVNWIIWI